MRVIIFLPSIEKGGVERNCIFLSNYLIGKLNSFRGIQEGIENTNYLLLADQKKYILTIYEKRVKEQDLPFFSELMMGLNKSGFQCPIPVLNKDNNSITEFNNKKLMIVSFIEGKAKKILSPENCKSVGIEAQPEYVDIGLRRVLGFESANGRPLTAPQKTIKQKNRNGIKNARVNDVVEDLFNASK